MNHPEKYTVTEIQNWESFEGGSDGYRPARPMPYTGFRSRRMNLITLKLIWGVITGRYDVLDWDVPYSDWRNKINKCSKP